MDTRQLPQADVVATLLQTGRQLAFFPVQENKAIPHGKPYVILQKSDGGEELRFLDEVFVAPDRITGTVHMQDEKSFLHYFGIYKRTQSLIYASLEPAQITAVFNEHEISASHAGQCPQWRDHRAILTLAFSKEWTTWTGRNGAQKKFAGTVEFAEWLEDQLPDITSPPNGEFMEVILAFKVQEQITFRQHSRLSDGQIQFVYDHIVEGQAPRGGQEARIPERFFIDVPVFQGRDAPKYQVEARFRYRVHGGSLSLWYELVRPHKVIEAAFNDIWKKIEDESGKKILLGRPE